MQMALFAARLLLAFVFAVAGLAKLANRARTRKLTTDFGLPAFLVSPISLLLPLGELVCAIALLSTASAWWGAAGVFALLVLFMAVIGASLARGRRPDCQCFGQLRATPIGASTLVRNAVLAAVAATILWQGRHNAGPAVLDALAALSLSASLLALLSALAVLTVVELVMIYQLLRQNGRLLLRVDGLEDRLGAAADPPVAGLPVNSAVPAFTLKDLDGRSVTLGTLPTHGRALLLVFTEPGCGACDALLPEVAAWQRDHEDRLLVVPIGRGDVRVNRTKSERHNLQHALLQGDREVSTLFHVDAMPCAVLVKDGRIGSPAAPGADAIRALVASATLPPSLERSDRVPSFLLEDLDGGTVDLAALRDRPTLLLFWSPSCGFCQQMLDDVKRWERSNGFDVPDLLVVSGGSADANRRQGFRSRVVLDPSFRVGNAFGAGGTPSAVLIDEDGTVASAVAVGVPDVLALFAASSPPKVLAAVARS